MKLLVGIFLSVLLMPWGVSAAWPSDPEVGPPQVKVKLRNQGQGEAREIVVGPRGIGLCKKASDCGNYFTVRWIGGRDDDSERIRIRFDDPEAAGACFERTDFTVDDTGPGGQVTVRLRADNPDCRGKSAFFYTVSCEGGEGGDCGGVEPVDPGAMIDG